MALLPQPYAMASEEFFLHEVRQRVRVPLTDGQALRLGYVACDALMAGVRSGLTLGKARHRADNAVGRVSHELGLGLSLADGMHLVGAAEDQLC